MKQVRINSVTARPMTDEQYALARSVVMRVCAQTNFQERQRTANDCKNSRSPVPLAQR